MFEPDISTPPAGADPTRKRYELEDMGFREVPKKWRKFYRHWGGPGDALSPNEVVCPVCKVVVRSTRELRPGDKVYCMPCMSRMVIVDHGNGYLEADVIF